MRSPLEEDSPTKPRAANLRRGSIAGRTRAAAESPAKKAPAADAKKPKAEKPTASQSPSRKPRASKAAAEPAAEPAAAPARARSSTRKSPAKKPAAAAAPAVEKKPTKSSASRRSSSRARAKPEDDNKEEKEEEEEEAKPATKKAARAASPAKKPAAKTAASRAASPAKKTATKPAAKSATRAASPAKKKPAAKPVPAQVEEEDDDEEKPAPVTPKKRVASRSSSKKPKAAAEAEAEQVPITPVKTPVRRPRSRFAQASAEEEASEEEDEEEQVEEKVEQVKENAPRYDLRTPIPEYVDVDVTSPTAHMYRHKSPQINIQGLDIVFFILLFVYIFTVVLFSTWQAIPTLNGVIIAAFPQQAEFLLQAQQKLAVLKSGEMFALDIIAFSIAIASYYWKLRDHNIHRNVVARVASLLLRLSVSSAAIIVWLILHNTPFVTIGQSLYIISLVLSALLAVDTVFSAFFVLTFPRLVENITALSLSLYFLFVANDPNLLAQLPQQITALLPPTVQAPLAFVFVTYFIVNVLEAVGNIGIFSTDNDSDLARSVTAISHGFVWLHGLSCLLLVGWFFAREIVPIVLAQSENLRQELTPKAIAFICQIVLFFAQVADASSYQYFDAVPRQNVAHFD